MITVILSFKLLLWSSAPSYLLFIPSNVFFISDIVFFISNWLFFYGLYVLFNAYYSFKFSLRLSFLPLRSLSSLITIVLNSASGILVACISFFFFLVIFPVLSFGAYFFVSPSCLYVLCKSAMTPKLVMMTLWWCLFWLSGRIFQITWARCSRNASCGLCASSCCSWVLNAFGPIVGAINIIRLAEYKDKPQSLCMRRYAGDALWGRVVLSNVWCLLESPFGYTAFVSNWV